MNDEIYQKLSLSRSDQECRANALFSFFFENKFCFQKFFKFDFKAWRLPKFFIEKKFKNLLKETN
jgi:hypothetical protein